MRIALGVILVLAGVATLALSGYGYWQCFIAADGDLPEARELKRQAAEEVQRRGDQSGALRELVTKPVPEQVAADPQKAERTVLEARAFLAEWDEIVRWTDQAIKEGSRTWRLWHFVKASVVLLLAIGVITAGVERLRRGRPSRAEPNAADVT
jgi:hypothetical protein